MIYVASRVKLRPVGSWILHPAVKQNHYFASAVLEAQRLCELPRERGFARIP